MKKIFQNVVIFTGLYFTILLLDIIVKINLSTIPYRFLTKPLVILSLVVYYTISLKNSAQKKHKYMLTALGLFLLGDIFLLFKGVVFFGLGMLFFIAAKWFYILRLSVQRDFSIKGLAPLIIGAVLYMIVITYYTFDQLGGFFIPVFLYMFTVMILLLFSYIRKSNVLPKSFRMVFLGVLFSIISDTAVLFNEFLALNKLSVSIIIMLFYGVSQYFIVVGVTNEMTNKTLH